MAERVRKLAGRTFMVAALVGGSYHTSRLAVANDQWDDAKDMLGTVQPLAKRLNTTETLDHKTVVKTLLDKNSRIKDGFVNQEIQEAVAFLNENKDDEIMRALLVQTLEDDLDRRKKERNDAGFIYLLGAISSAILGISGWKLSSDKRRKHINRVRVGS